MELNAGQQSMFIDLIQGFPEGKNLTKSEVLKIMESCRFQEFWDGKAYSMEGEVAGGLSFLNTGMFKITNVKTCLGKEKLRDVNFAGYNSMVGNLDSLYMRSPAPTSIHSVGISTAFGFSYSDIMFLRKDIQVFVILFFK